MTRLLQSKNEHVHVHVHAMGCPLIKSHTPSECVLVCPVLVPLRFPSGPSVHPLLLFRAFPPLWNSHTHTHTNQANQANTSRLTQCALATTGRATRWRARKFSCLYRLGFFFFVLGLGSIVLDYSYGLVFIFRLWVRATNHRERRERTKSQTFF